MKKRKVLGAIAGVMAIAIAAGATYAWFVSTDTQTVTVNAANITLKPTATSGTITTSLSNKLPGETVTAATDYTLVNTSTRKSLVKVVVKVKEDPNDVKPAFVDDQNKRREALIAELNNSLDIGLDSSFKTIADYENAYYKFYDEFKPADPDASTVKFDISLIVPDEVGGNVLGIATDRTADQQAEHGMELVEIEYTAVAIQASENAINNYFGAAEGAAIIAAFTADDPTQGFLAY